MITFPDGTTVPALGQGTWNMGDSSATRESEIDALRTGIDLGLTVIDTAEMYGSGRSEELVADGSIGAWGVSNLDADELAELPDGCQTDQVLYNLTRRGPEFDLLPWASQVGMPVMAYSPVEQGRLLGDTDLADIARDLTATPTQVALAWTMRSGSVLAIPKASTADHVRENAAARELRLTEEDLARLDRAFPPPTSPVPLEMI